MYTYCMDALQALLDAGPTPLDDILALGDWLMLTQYHLTSTIHPELGMMFRIETGRASSDHLYRITWLRNGVPGRDGDDVPAEVLFTGIRGRPVEKKWFNLKGQLHRDGDKPAVVTTEMLEWYQNGKLHREHGPARHVRHLHASPPFRELMWYQDGKRHRDVMEPANALAWPVDQGQPAPWTNRDGALFLRGRFVRWTFQTVPVPAKEWVYDNVHFRVELDMDLAVNLSLHQKCW
jgi:hypothetical protein